MIVAGTLLINKGTKIMVKDNKRNLGDPLTTTEADADEEKLRQLEAKVSKMKMATDNILNAKSKD